MKFWYLPLFMLPNVKENKKYILSFCKPIVLLSLLAGLYSASTLPKNALHLFMPIFINSNIFCGMLYPLSSNTFLHGVCSFLIQLLFQRVQIAVLFNIINFLTYVKWKYFLIFYQISHSISIYRKAVTFSGHLFTFHILSDCILFEPALYI